MFKTRHTVAALSVAFAFGLTTSIAAPPDRDTGNGSNNGTSTCQQDVTGDGYVGFDDIVKVLYDWGECPLMAPSRDAAFDDVNGAGVERRVCTAADVNGDGFVGILDLLQVMDAYSFHCDRLNGG